MSSNPQCGLTPWKTHGVRSFNHLNIKFWKSIEFDCLPFLPLFCSFVIPTQSLSIYLFYGGTWPELSLSSPHPETNMSRPGIKPWPPAMQAGTLPKSYLDSLQIGQFWSSTWQPHCMELILHINSGHQMIASRSPLIRRLQVDHPRHLQSACLSHVRVTTMEEPDQSSLHLQIKHPKQTCPGRDPKPGRLSHRRAL